MILAAGRGERMRPLSGRDAEAAARRRAASRSSSGRSSARARRLPRHRHQRRVPRAATRGSAWATALRSACASRGRSSPSRWRRAGGIATALPLLPAGPALIVSGDVWTHVRLRDAAARADAMARTIRAAARPSRDGAQSAVPSGRRFRARRRPHRAATGASKLTFGNIGLYDTALFRELPRGVKLKLLPLYRDWIARGWVSGERFDGPWANVGTPADLAALDRRLTAHKALTPTRSRTRRRSMDAIANPLLDFPGLPRFDAIRAGARHARGRRAARAKRARRSSASRRTRDPPTWERVVEPLAEALDRLDRAWGAVRHLNAVVNTPELRDAYNANQPKLVAFYTDLAQDLRLYAKYRALREAAVLRLARRRATQADRQRVARLQAGRRRAGRRREGASQGGATRNWPTCRRGSRSIVLDATNAWAHYSSTTKRSWPAFRPTWWPRRARRREADGKPGWKLTLRMPCYLPVMQYAQNRDLRRRLHEALRRRAHPISAPIPNGTTAR